MYFNEFDPFAAQWLGKLFPTSTVDKRSIRMSRQKTLFSSIDVISSAESAAGNSHCDLPGPEDWPVWTGSCPCQPYSAAGKQKVKPTTDTCGPKCSGSSASVALQSSLVSRLKPRLDSVGSMEYSQTWRAKVTPAGRSYWALYSVGAPHLDSESTGWPTPAAQNAQGGSLGNDRSGISLHSTDRLLRWRVGQRHKRRTPKQRRESGQRGKRDRHTPQNVRALCGCPTAGWVSPSSRDWKDSPMATVGVNPDGSRGIGWTSCRDRPVGGPAGSVFGLLHGVDHGGTGESRAAVSGLRPAFGPTTTSFPPRREIAAR